MGRLLLGAPSRWPKLHMNFFGHTALASSHFADAEPALDERAFALLCLGSMLPDFVGMLRLSRPAVLDSVLARGVAFHHRTDEAFHDLPPFVSLSRESFAWLSERGLPRGPARAIAHIGVEMLLDEPLAADPGARRAYRAALGQSLSGALSFPTPSDAERLGALQTALLERSQGPRHASPLVVAERIRRTLAGRPRLATADGTEVLLAEWVERTRPAVVAAAPEILARLRLLLANFGGAQ